MGLQIPVRERLHFPQYEINAQYLLKENNAPLAQSRLKEWYKAKANGELTTVWFCDDARLLASFALGTFNILPIRTIAAAGDPKPFRYMIDHPSVQQGVVLGHYDSDLQMPGEILRGCGGEGVKMSRISVTKMGPRDEAPGFVDRHIDSPDVVYQTLKSAWRIAQLSKDGKPILAGLWDSATYQIIPIGFFNKRGKEYAGIIPFNELKNKQTQLITPETLLQISEDILPQEMRKLLMRNQQLCKEYAESVFFKQFKESQKVQDPPLVMITTSAVPIGVRYPGLHRPNTVFKIALPYEKSENSGGSFSLNAEEVNKVIAQAHYPIGESIEAQKGHPFYNTKTLLIETPNIAASQEIVKKLVRKDWFMKWIQEKGGKVIIAEKHSGKISQIHDLDILNGTYSV